MTVELRDTFTRMMLPVTAHGATRRSPSALGDGDWIEQYDAKIGIWGCIHFAPHCHNCGAPDAARHDESGLTLCAGCELGWDETYALCEMDLHGDAMSDEVGE